MSTNTSSLRSPRGFLRDLLPSLLLNIAVPLLLYWISKTFISPSEVIALSLASLFPLADSIYGVVRRHQLDVIAVIALLGTGVGLIGVLLGGDAKLLLIRESFFTGALGLACFFSLLLPRPLMFYFGRQFIAGKDPARLKDFNNQWHAPYARFVHRLITIVWGVTFLGEFLLRVLLVYTLPVPVVLAVSPLILTAVTIVAFVWTFAYVRYATRRGKAMREAAQAQQNNTAPTP